MGIQPGLLRAERSVSLYLTRDQARLVADMAARHGMTPDTILIEAIGHGLAMIAMGVDLVDNDPPF